MSPKESFQFPDVADRRLIFSINSGRSGSKFLAELLGTAPGVKSFHEAEPKMNGEFIAMINAEPLERSFEKRRIKSAAIADVLRRSAPNEVYAETNHTFIKSFFDVVVTDFRNLDVVILRRALSHVLKSFIELGYFSPLNPLSYAWMSSPNAATAALPSIGPDASLDQFDLCIAYLLDIEARAQRFKATYPNVRTHDLRLEEVNHPAQVESLFARLHLTVTEATRRLGGKKSNERSARKQQIKAAVTIEECRARLEAYLRKARDRGIEIPATAALD